MEKDRLFFRRQSKRYNNECKDGILKFFCISFYA